MLNAHTKLWFLKDSSPVSKGGLNIIPTPSKAKAMVKIGTILHVSFRKTQASRNTKTVELLVITKASPMEMYWSELK